MCSLIVAIKPWPGGYTADQFMKCHDLHFYYAFIIVHQIQRSNLKNSIEFRRPNSYVTKSDYAKLIYNSHRNVLGTLSLYDSSITAF